MSIEATARPHPGPTVLSRCDNPEGEGANAERPLASSAADGPGITLCFAAATFLGAFLLFLVQPLIAKYILPWFGGGAGVWTTCILFFQAILLGGYLYAHLGVSRLPVRSQAIVHLLLLLAVAVALPAVMPGERWKPLLASGDKSPIGEILLLLVATLGLPCLALSATSPLLHSWYSRLRPGAAVYRLFALSNVGSLLALLAYPLIVEPMLSRRVQAMAWSIGLAAFAVLCAACAWLAARHKGNLTAARADTTSEFDAPATPPITISATTRAFWLALSACASALLLATTNTITQDFAPIPFLWVLPLAIYLITFIIAFDRPDWYNRPLFGAVLIVCLAGSVLLLTQPREALALWVLVGTLSLTLFVGCMTLHGELARLRPPVAHLTSYYLTIAAGGVLGGVLVGIGAPLLLQSYSELHLALWTTALLAILAPIAISRKMPGTEVAVPTFIGLFVLGALLWTTCQPALVGGKLVSRTRDFYGVLTVWEVSIAAQGKGLLLQHGSTTHGHQFVRPSLRAAPSTYYNPVSGVGFVLGEKSPLPRPRTVGIIGLGSGTLGAYAQANDVYRFYEISPNVLRYAHDPFTYLKDLTQRGASVETILGDGRLSMERELKQNYDVLVLDAFSGDAIPVHLLTREAFDVYKNHLNPTGVICIHVSNRHLDLGAVVSAAAQRLGWEAVMHRSEWVEKNVQFPATWIMLSPDPQQIESLRQMGAEPLLPAKPGFQAWTDEYTTMLGIVR